MFQFLTFSGPGRLSVSICSLVRSWWSKREITGWSEARVMTVFVFVLLFELLRPREGVCERLLGCGHFGPNESLWDGLELEL